MANQETAHAGGSSADLSINSPAKMVATLGLSVFIAEFGIMALLPSLREMSLTASGLVDSLLLTLLLAPVLYGALFRPLRAHISELREARAKLVSHNDRLRLAESRLVRTVSLLSRCDGLVIRAKEEGQLLADICQLAVETGGYLMAWVGFDGEGGHAVPVAQSGQGRAGQPGRGPAEEAIRTGRVVVAQDFQGVAGGKSDCVALPLVLQGRTAGSLVIHSAAPDAFDPEEAALLERLADNLAYGMEVLRTRSEKEAAEFALRQENEKNLALLRNASDGIHILDAGGNLVEASDAFCKMLGYDRDELIGRNVSFWDDGFEDAEKMLQKVREQIEKPERSQFEARHRRKDGSRFDVEVSGLSLKLGGRAVLFNSSRDISDKETRRGRASRLQGKA